jgi:hypothetical protein
MIAPTGAEVAHLWHALDYIAGSECNVPIPFQHAVRTLQWGDQDPAQAGLESAWCTWRVSGAQFFTIFKLNWTSCCVYSHGANLVSKKTKLNPKP